jgi:hypothetical protein
MLNPELMFQYELSIPYVEFELFSGSSFIEVELKEDAVSLIERERWYDS